MSGKNKDKKNFVKKLKEKHKRIFECIKNKRQEILE